ncbi:MAG: hypothetical protein R2861_16475 [Desulfobacterales bacterium]
MTEALDRLDRVLSLETAENGQKAHALLLKAQVYKIPPRATRLWIPFGPSLPVTRKNESGWIWPWIISSAVSWQALPRRIQRKNPGVESTGRKQQKGRTTLAMGRLTGSEIFITHPETWFRQRPHIRMCWTLIPP